MTTVRTDITDRERELGAIIHAYNEVTDRLKQSHELLTSEVGRLREELARKNRELRRRERLAALGEMAAGLAHEIRNPLGGIRVFASLLEQDLGDRPDACRLVRKIDRGVLRLEKIVTDILEFGRPAQPNPGRVDVLRLMQETAELARSTSGEDVDVEVRSDETEMQFMTDGAMLQRALLNLVRNAMEASASSSPPGCVMLEAGRAGEHGWQVRVLDDGPGIAREDMDRIFNPFFTRKDTGTGLGLAIVHQIVVSLGGQIKAGNRREGGAVFTIVLPSDWNANVIDTDPAGPVMSEMHES